MRGHIDRHAIDGDGEVRAVVEIEAAQKILGGFASPECWVTISPGTISSNSPTRDAGRALNSCPVKRISLAAAG
jgi:hypothetical protein